MSIFFHLVHHLLPVIIFTLIQPSTSFFFNISSFNANMSSMVYEGDGTINSAGSIDLTNTAFFYQLGRATYSRPIQMWDAATKQVSDFTTTFAFTIDTLNISYYGYALSFFLAPVGSHTPINSAGEFNGLYNTSSYKAGAANQILAVEFDSFVNPDFDPPYEHVGINVNSIQSVVVVPWNSSFHSQQLGRAKITYSSAAQLLNVSVSYDGKPERYDLQSDLDLMGVLAEWSVVGFVASTGRTMEQHTIHSWQFSSTFDTEMPQINIAASNGDNHKPNRVDKWLIFFAALAFVFLLFLVAISIIWIRLRNPDAKLISEEMYGLSSVGCVLDQRGAWPRRFLHRELVKATNNFSDEKKLGKGGFGFVYKGVLEEYNLEVAVKRIFREANQGKMSYLTEVLTIGCLRHRNLVKLIGWCHDQGEFLLVYEFMPNGSLDFHLFGQSTSLAWSVRYKIAQELASALLYLHEEWEQCVIHRDIKSSNVMLDSQFNVKLGDFGLAKLMDHAISLKTTAVAGTPGYLAPEYIQKRKASKESDVYSFGIVALEIGCGRKSVEHDVEEWRVSLVEWVWSLYGQGKLLDAADERLGKVFDEKQMECLLLIGLWCAHPDHTLRPSIREAIQVLNFEAPLPQIPLAMPVPVYEVPIMQANHSGQGSISLTDIENGR